ncbi:hypothetical protein B1810_10715 [Panacagrimonas perspica]|nr:hypothetical protein B1810_10715 [Panacagrimonas perspica]
MFGVTNWITAHEPGGFDWPEIFLSDVLALNRQTQTHDGDGKAAPARTLSERRSASARFGSGS